MQLRKVLGLLCFLTSFAGVLPVVSQSASVANKKTAVRYLKLSEQYAADKKWEEAKSNAKIGLAYDDSIADLWYINAVSDLNLKYPKYKIIPLLVKSLTQGQWVDYNRESARVMYADLLASTREFDQALAVLDGDPFIYSADAEYIRAKSYYNLHDENSIQKAREKIDAARRIYPDDKRFAELFFRYEYALGGRKEDNQKIADSFISLVSMYKNPGSELEMYASLFASGEQKVRMLKSFNARSYKSPMYPAAAIKEGLIEEVKALDYFYKFADKSVDFSVLKAFANSLTNPDCIREFGEYLNAYNGQILIDTDGDLTFNMTVDYKRGRPQKISYDKEQDDRNEWTCECDFGVPVSVHLTEGELDIEYGSWPSVSRATYLGEGNSSKLTFNLVAESLNWTPFYINPDKDFKQSPGVEFFVPVVPEKVQNVSGQQLLYACSSYELPSKERKNAVIHVSVLDGMAQLGRYYVDDKMYAQTQFSQGLPAFRTVDMDGDGLFETVETYGFSRDQKQNYISEQDELQIMTNLFGDGETGTGFYVKMIQVDSNGDTIPDFTEEYTEGYGKISSWDLNSNGQWDVRYVKYPVSDDGVLLEESMFYEPLHNSLVTVLLKNGLPVKVTDGKRELPVVKAAGEELYWVGNAGTKKDAKTILKYVNQSTVQGVCSIVETDINRMLAVRIGKYVFGQILPSAPVIMEKIEDENK